MRSLLKSSLLALLSFPFFLHGQIPTTSLNADATSAFQQASLQLASGQANQGKALLLKALSYDYNYIDAIRQLADFYYTRNQIDSAIYYYERNINILPRDLYAHNWLVTIYLQIKDYDAALIQYDLILRTFADKREVLADTYYNIADIEYRYKNRWQASIDMSEEAMRQYLSIASHLENPAYRALVNTKAAQARMIAAKGYYVLGNHKIALKFLKENAKYLDGDPEYMFFLGNTYYQLGKTEKGEVFIRQAFLNGFEIPLEILMSGYELPREFLLDHPEYEKN